MNASISRAYMSHPPQQILRFALLLHCHAQSQFGSSCIGCGLVILNHYFPAIFIASSRSSTFSPLSRGLRVSSRFPPRSILLYPREQASFNTQFTDLPPPLNVGSRNFTILAISLTYVPCWEAQEWQPETYRHKRREANLTVISIVLRITIHESHCKHSATMQFYMVLFHYIVTSTQYRLRKRTLIYILRFGRERCTELR